VDGKSLRAITGVDGDDGEEEARLLEDQDGVTGDGDSAGDDPDLSLATLPTEAEAGPNVLLAAGWCCSGVVGSDNVPGLLEDDLRKLLSGACHTVATISFLHQIITISNCQDETTCNFKSDKISF
jgi:hypothetical protein